MNKILSVFCEAMHRIVPVHLSIESAKHAFGELRDWLKEKEPAFVAGIEKADRVVDEAGAVASLIPGVAAPAAIVQHVLDGVAGELVHVADDGTRTLLAPFPPESDLPTLVGGQIVHAVKDQPDSVLALVASSAASAAVPEGDSEKTGA